MELFQEQRQEQQLIMTQEMRQSLEVLQVSALELINIIEKEAEDNPLIEILEDRFEDISRTSDHSNLEEGYIDEDIYEDIKKTSYFNHDDSTTDIINKLTAKETPILEELLSEVRLDLKNESEQKIAEEIINYINNKGFLEITEEEILEKLNKNPNTKFNLESIIKVKKIIKNTEPGGIGCNDISEYLIFQIENKEIIKKEIVIKMLNENFEDFMRKKIKQLKKDLDFSEEELKKIYTLVSTLKPYPLVGYAMEDNKSKEVIIPEIILKEENGEFEIYLNDKYLPEIKINNEYYKMLSNDEKALNYLKEKAMKIRTLEKCIEQRNITMYRVAKTIVEAQKDFFKFGEKYFKPLTLYDIGVVLNLHESTISRVVNNKYMETPRGIFELKYFFSGRVETYRGAAMSIVAVQKMIGEIIKRENKKKPLTDNEICEFLKDKKGLKISSRTVTNYRESMKILPTYLRKEL